MSQQDWFVTDIGQCQPRPSAREWDLLRERYYLHQFLTEILEILANALAETDEWDYLPQIRMRVRQLMLNSYYVKTRYTEPEPQTGVSVTTLYDEIGYPLTVQNVMVNPGVMSPIHSHGTWGVLFQIRGQERHTFWRRVNDPEQPYRIEAVGDRTLDPGEIISFMPDAIHQVETVGDEPSLTFQLYGDTQPKSRLQFEPTTHTAKRF